MASVFVPVLYLVIVLGGLLVFSSFYRRRAAGKLVDAYFPSHPARDAYITLLQRDPPPRDQVLKAALLARAAADVQRVLALREDKPAAQALLQKGALGDATWQALLAAEKELEAEILDVVAEANAYVPGWGQIVFETASQLVANDKMRALLEATGKMRADAEAVYGPGKRIELPPMQPVLQMGPPPPGAPPANGNAPQQMSRAPSAGAPAGAPQQMARAPSGGLAAPPTPSTPSALKSPKTPLSALQSLPSAGADSAASSDAESTSSPSKSKKNKKRK